MDKVTRQCPQTTTFLKRKESRSGIEPRSFRGHVDDDDEVMLNVLICQLTY